MATSLLTWWTRDTALHSFVFCQFLLGLPFSVFNTYILYQLLVVGLFVGTGPNGSSCTTYCTVSWAGSQLDLNSILLYMNALAFGIGGAVTFFLSAYSDFWSHKHLLVTFFIVCYGVLATPVYWLQEFTISRFRILTALYVAFNIVTLILVAVLNIYIPYCMRNSAKTTSAKVTPDEVREADAVAVVTNDPRAGPRRSYAFNMAIFGTVANAVGAIIIFAIVVILLQTRTGFAALSSGLLVTTIIGFITIAGSIVAFFGLPPIPSTSVEGLKGNWARPIIEFVMPVKDLLKRKSMAALMAAFTIYTDSTFAVNSATLQLFITEIRPGTLEITLYAMAQSVFNLVCSLVFLWLRPKLGLKIETWLIIGYALILLVPVWGCIGLSHVDFGLKNRWEFYVQQLLSIVSSTLVNAAFRVLFSEMIPTGNEVRWFGLQLVLSCATIWINYVASAPLQNATHQLRFPMIISLVFLIVALVIEMCRTRLPVFIHDRQKWHDIDQANATAATDNNEVAPDGNPRRSSSGEHQNEAKDLDDTAAAAAAAAVRQNITVGGKSIGVE